MVVFNALGVKQFYLHLWVSNTTKFYARKHYRPKKWSPETKQVKRKIYM